ncbi:heme-degrading domain-containing protein [Puniceibacterium confluentis]|uniref:heme-degrading domain-containing protein n=1 Tax=Puniceibacterium confluentis TaxID=1958944 RepID=UPI00164614AB|nr:heme-degrading domain-containing protein [Puniceibacterium confluentis]
MTVQQLEEIAGQEARLRLTGFDEAQAWKLGCLLVEKGRAEGRPIVVNIRTPDSTLFHAALSGATPDNDHWARRKSNVTLRYHRASLAVGLSFKAKGILVPGAEHGLDPQEYAVHGGSFPVRLTSGRVIAAVTVSGLASEEDHAMVVEALGSLLG